MTTAILVVALVAGGVVRFARHRGEAADRRALDREAEIATVSQTVAQAERFAFAREIHDSVSHAVGLIALQAAAAEVSGRSDPEVADRAFDVIELTARSALDDLDGLDPSADSRAPDHRDLEGLVGRIRASGYPVELVIEGTLPAVHLSVVYRVVQEGLTNVVRHAPGALTQVLVLAGPAETTVRVTNESLANTPGNCHSGYGLVGLRERLGFAGGTLHAGPTSAGFEVLARLPASAPDQHEVTA